MKGYKNDSGPTLRKRSVIYLVTVNGQTGWKSELSIILACCQVMVSQCKIVRLLISAFSVSIQNKENRMQWLAIAFAFV